MPGNEVGGSTLVTKMFAFLKYLEKWDASRVHLLIFIFMVKYIYLRILKNYKNKTCLRDNFIYTFRENIIIEIARVKGIICNRIIIR